MNKQEEIKGVKDTTECQGCLFLLHYEFDGKKFNLPRCSVGFRDGSKVSHPCPDKPKVVSATVKPLIDRRNN